MIFRTFKESIAKLTEEIRQLRFAISGKDEAALRAVTKQLDTAGNSLKKTVDQNQPTTK